MEAICIFLPPDWKASRNMPEQMPKAETEQVRRYGVEQDQDPCKRCSPGDRKGPGKAVCSPSGAKWLPVRGDTVWQKEFEELFPYEETDDQLDAIEAVKRTWKAERSWTG